MSDETANAICDLINEACAAGDLTHDELDEISDLVDFRLKEMKRQNGAKVAATLSKGSHVRIRRDANLRPRYILGTEATVIKINQTTASITLGEVRGGSGRFFTGQEIRCPLDALELAEGA